MPGRFARPLIQYIKKPKRLGAFFQGLLSNGLIPLLSGSFGIIRLCAREVLSLLADQSQLSNYVVQNISFLFYEQEQ